MYLQWLTGYNVVLQEELRLAAIKEQLAALKGNLADDDDDAQQKQVDTEDESSASEMDTAVLDSVSGTPFQSLVNMEWSQLSDSDAEDVLGILEVSDNIAESQDITTTPSRSQTWTNTPSDLLTIGEVLERGATVSPSKQRWRDGGDSSTLDPSQDFPQMHSMFSPPRTPSQSQTLANDPNSHKKRKRRTVEGF